MAEPTLGEITNLKVDPELGTGNTGYAIDNRDLVRNLTQAAQFKSQNDWKKYNEFLQDTKEKYKDAQEIASMDVAPQDRERLEKEMTGFLNDMATNPKDFFSSVGSAKGKELQQRLIDWRKDATTSKNDNLWDKQNRKFLAENPDHDTPENRQKIEGFLTNQKLGARQPYILDMPSAYDPNALGKEVNSAIEQKVAQPGMTPDGKFTYTETGTKYDKQRYRQITSNMYDLNQKGFQNTIANTFKILPASEQVKYKDSPNPAKDWFLDFQDIFRKPDQVTKDDLKANAFALEGEKAKVQFALEALKNRDTEGREIRVAQIKQQLTDAPKPEQTKFLLNLASSVVGNTTGQTLTVDIGKGNYSTEQVIDASPNIKKMFSKPIKTTIKDASGKDITTENALEPDVITRTPDGGLRTVFYKKTPKGATVMSGNKPVSETTEIVPLPEVMAILGKDYMPKKDLPGAVNYAGDVLKQFGGDITKYAQAANAKPDTKGKTYKLGNKTYTEEQISKAAKQSGMSIDDYKKQVGIQ